MNLFFFPDYTSTNPYQNLLYSSLNDDGHNVVSGDITKAIEFLSINSGQQTFFHLHWQNVITGPAGSAHEHRIFARSFIKKLKMFKGLGGVIVWTIHNKLPHDIKFLRAEIEFHTALNQVADVILLHDESSLQVIQKEYKVDSSKVKYLKHGNYIGSYQNKLSGKEARDYLNISQDHFVYGFVGQLRPYKGLNELIEASYSFSNQQNITGLIAGKPVWPYNKGKVTQLCSPLRHLKVFEGFIPDTELQVYLNASDVIVLPYKDILTSGSVILAASFGKPVVIPEIDSFKHLLNFPFVFTYDPTNENGLFETLSAIQEISRDELITHGQDALEYAKSLDWNDIGIELQNILHKLSSEKNVQYDISYEDKVVTITTNRSFELSMDGDVAVCVVNYHSHRQVDELAQSINKNSKCKTTLFVLDNSVDKLEYSELSAIENINYLIRTEKNLGYAAGNNVLIKIAKDHGFSKVAILNPDTLIVEDVFSTLSADINENPNAIYSPLILKDSQTISFFRAKIKDNSDTLNIEHELDGCPKEFASKGIFETDALNGCALFFDPIIVDTFCYIPEQYFLYFEETDWTTTIKTGGGQLYVNSNTTIIHKKATQAGGLPALTYTYYLLRNALIFAKKYGYDVEKTEAKYVDSFVNPWINLVSQRSPHMVNCFQSLCKVAFEHGRKGISGEQDFISELPNYSGSVNDSNGFIEIKTNTGISGWSISDSKQDAEPAQLLLVNNQKYIKPFGVSLTREDVAAAGLNPLAGFDIEVDVNFDPLNLDVLDAHSLKKLIKLESFLDSKKQLKVTAPENPSFDIRSVQACIEGYNSGKIVGWAYDAAQLDIPLELELYIDGKLRSIAFASEFREDLVQVGKGKGKSGFSFYMAPCDIEDEDVEVDCVVRIRGRQDDLAAETLNMRQTLKGYDIHTNLSDFLKWSFFNIMSPYGAFENSQRLQRECDFLKQILSQKAQSIPEKNRAFISVIMPAFNRQNEIEMAITSVVEQSYQEFELIIIDDGSSDNTVQVVNRLIETLELRDKIKVIPLGSNGGVSHARNVGLSESKGDIITYLDSDNEWDLNYLSIVNLFYTENIESDTAYAGQEVWFVDELSERKFRTNVRMVPFNRSAIEDSNFIDLNVFSHRKGVMETHGKFREDIRRLVDWELILRYTKDKPPLFIPALLNRYYFGFADNQITSTESYVNNLHKLLQGSK